jgi:hypothetical protein
MRNIKAFNLHGTKFERLQKSFHSARAAIFFQRYTCEGEAGPTGFSHSRHEFDDVCDPKDPYGAATFRRIAQQGFQLAGPPDTRFHSMFPEQLDNPGEVASIFENLLIIFVPEVCYARFTIPPDHSSGSCPVCKSPEPEPIKPSL